MRQQLFMVMVVVLTVLGGCASYEADAKAPMEPAARGGGDFGPNDAAEPMAEPMADEVSLEAAEDSGGGLFRGGLDFMSRFEDKRLAQTTTDPKPASGAPPATTAPAPPPTKVTPDVPKPEPGSAGATKVAGPLLIYTATFHMAVFEAGPSIDATYKLAKDMGGYLVRRDQRTASVRERVSYNVAQIAAPSSVIPQLSARDNSRDNALISNGFSRNPHAPADSKLSIFSSLE